MKKLITIITVLALAISSFYVPTAKAETLPEPEGHWMLDEGSGTAATDSSGNGHHGTFMQGAPAWTAGKFGGGINAYNAFPSYYATIPYNLDWDEDLSISMWIKGVPDNTVPTVRALTGFNSEDIWDLKLRLNISSATLSVNSSCVNETGGISVDHNITDSDWHHIVLTKAPNRFYIYLDGNLIRTITWTNNGNCSGPSHLYLGGFDGNTSINHPVDDFRLYTTALTQRQVQLLALECDIEGRECESNDIPITANVPQDLTFNISANLCNLGSLSSSSTSTCTHTMSASTNAAHGYNITYLPTSTLTSANLDEIDDTGASGAIASVGTKQFGFNLVSNSSPSVGANPSGGIGSVSSNYNTSNIFSFNTSGATVAASSGPSENTTYTASYIANIDGNTVAGEYSTVVTYVITASY